MAPGSHVGCLEMGEDASVAVRLWGPQLDTSLRGKTCRIRFRDNDECLEPLDSRAPGEESPCPCRVVPVQRGWRPPSLSPHPGWHHPGCHAFCWRTGGRIEVAVTTSPTDAEVPPTPVPRTPKVPGSTDDGFCDPHGLIRTTCLQINPYEFPVASSFLRNRSYKEKFDESSQI